jgi:two-component system, NarL family, response regulator DesR
MHRVLIVDDGGNFRDSMARIIQDHLALTVVAAARSMDEALELAQTTHPGLIILDLRIPKHLHEPAESRYGIATLHALHALPQPAKIVLWSYLPAGPWLRAIESLIEGYIGKDQDTYVIVELIRSVLSGGKAYTPTQREMLAHVDIHITPREAEVLQLVVKGRKDEEIAESLSIASGTARRYVEILRDKFGVRTRGELGFLAQRKGYLPPEI